MISTGDCVYICDISAVVLVILQLAANSELRQKVLDLVLILKKSLGYITEGKCSVTSSGALFDDVSIFFSKPKCQRLVSVSACKCQLHAESCC